MTPLLLILNTSSSGDNLWVIVGLAFTFFGLLFAIIQSGNKNARSSGKIEESVDVLSKRVNKLDDSLEHVKSNNTATATSILKLENLMRDANMGGLLVRHSPRQLSPVGQEICKDSGVKEIVETNFEQIKEAVELQNPENAYQAEKLVLSFVGKLIDNPELKPKIEAGAFKSGYDIESVLLIGGIFIRDRILKTLGFIPEDIDKHTE